LYRYAGSAGVVALLSEIACAIFVLVITILEVIKVCRMRIKYFREIWNVLQLVALILFYIAVGLYTMRSVWTVYYYYHYYYYYYYYCTMRSVWTVWVVEDLMNNPGKLS